MLRSLLVGLDGSPSSGSAVELGLRLAKEHDALLVGLGVIDEPSIHQPEATPIGGGYYKQVADQVEMERARWQVEQLLEQFALQASEAGVASKLLEDVGDPAQRILLESQRYDVVLLGRETRLADASPNDTLKEVVKNSPRPVISVAHPLGNGRTILVAYDGSLQSARAVQGLVATGIAVGRPIQVVTAGSDSVKAAQVADRAVEFLRFHELDARSHPIEKDSAHQEIIKQARALDAGLIVMGAYGKRTLHEFVFGSCTSHMLQECGLPLMLYH